MELLAYKTGIKLTQIPYKGGAQSAAAVLAGEVHAAWVSGPQAMPQIKAGRFKPLAISSRVRNAALPDVPTMLESGVPGFAVDTWFGIHAPAATPPAIVKQLNAEITRIAKSKEMVERIEKSGSVPLYATPEEFAEMVNSEAKLWQDLFENVDLQSLRTN
jgi:tripartite-type tricarboxylate transporter receptor subunit TctC